MLVSSLLVSSKRTNPMMRAFLLIFLAGFIVVDGRTFEGPLIRGFYTSYPGVVSYKGTFYAVTSDDTVNVGPKLALFQSADLQNWAFLGFIFDNDTLPVWGGKTTYYAPEIHVISENNFRLFFSANQPYRIGVAFATNIAGPYVPLSDPLYSSGSQSAFEPNILKDNGIIRIYWRNSNGGIQGRDLSQDGLRLGSGSTYNLLQPTLKWETNAVTAPWVMKRMNWYYMFYSALPFGAGMSGIGVARSLQPYGPFTKRGDPIVFTNDNQSPAHCSVIFDVDNSTYVMIYYVKLNATMKGLMAKSLAWDSDDWPFVF